MKKTLLIVVLFLSLGCFAQGEANIWYFGYHAGLDFNSGNPVVLTDGQLNTQEGCSTISNATGQLLFYTNGVSVWNKNHQIMPNGSNLFGDSSSTQSAIIIPKPNDPNIYYIFTVAELAKPDGLKFSEVDLSLSGGLGDVNSNKNISLITPVCEKLTAVKNANGDGYWIVVHSYGNNSFLAYSITSAGINLTPIRSNLGAVIDTTGLNAIGYLKFSPDGTRLISCSPGNVEIFDFDNATGIISNKKLIWQEYDEYGAEFSPSGKIVYITSKFQKLIQFDLTSTNIPNSAIIIYDWNQNDPHHLGALQLAKNGKIYGCVWREQYVSIINNPDVLGIGCNFTLLGIQLNTGTCYSGLPQFIQSYFIIEINAQNNCMGETTTFSLSGNQTFTSAIWDFGDGFTSTAINPTHLYTSVGTYTVSVTTSGPNGTSTKKRDVIISKVPTATQPQNLLICDDNNDGQYLFDLTKQNAVILNGQDPNSYTVNYFANGTDYANNLTIATPSAYVNKNAYQAETIIAEVSNNANSTCKSATNFTIDVFDIPKPNLSVTRLASCDNTSAGTDTDGRVVFDLTQRATSILNGQAATQFLLSYYKDSALTQVIATPKVYQNTNATETIYVKMENMDNANCFATTSFKIEVLALPLITNVVDLKQCDDNIDGFSVFNLEEAISKITINSATETITFHKTLADAQNNTNIITNTTTYTNQTVSIDKVYVRVTNSNDCFRIAQLNLIVSTTQIPATFFKTFTQCDDAILGTNTDGIASFDFSEVTQNIQDIFPSGQLLDITYYQNVADALAEKNSIADISNYRNTSSPKGQSIYIRVDSKLNNDCLGLGGYITIKVEPIPIVQSMKQNHCDDDQDGLYAFDTSAIQTNLLNGLTNVTVSYFDQNNNSLSSPLPNPFVTASQTLKVVIKNNTPTACSYDSAVQFVVDDLPEAFPVPTLLNTFCDDEIDPTQQDGKYAFDTSTFQNTILGGQTGMTVKYYDKNNNSLPSPLPNPFVTVTQNVRVEVINPRNTACFATTTIPFIVNPIPNINLFGDELVCSNLSTFTKVLDAGLQDSSAIGNYSYVWSFNGSVIPRATNYTLTVNVKGIYTVQVFNNQYCSRMRIITVSASDIATITNVNIVDLADVNSITVSVTGVGDYVYGLDDENGAYQNEPIFTNVSAGIHTIFVKDLNGCGVTPKEVAVLGIPNYFTPNDDGVNDYWNIKGINAAFNAKTTIYIFDRYGKLIKEISPLSQGWNGTFNGHQMLSDDYWYSIQLEDGRIIKGHFALKR